ncbi:MAG: hypothetical protein K6F26_07815 [Lachnospiraceae bacterium]|nr:hypothetical protein [Lachnospiraceae bacterium]
MGWPFLIFYEEKWFVEYASMISINLVLAIVIELSLAYALGVRGKRNFGVMLNVNCITNPIIVTLAFLMIQAWGNGLLTRLLELPLEAVVVFVEGAVYRRKFGNTETEVSDEKLRSTEAEDSGKREVLPMNPFRLSLILNAVSYGVGVLLDVISSLK